MTDDPMTELNTDAIKWDLDPAPWPESSDLLALTVEVLPTIEDDRVVAFVERLATIVIDRDEASRRDPGCPLSGALRGARGTQRRRSSQRAADRTAERARARDNGQRPTKNGTYGTAPRANGQGASDKCQYRTRTVQKAQVTSDK